MKVSSAAYRVLLPFLVAGFSTALGSTSEGNPRRNPLVEELSATTGTTPQNAGTIGKKDVQNRFAAGTKRKKVWDPGKGLLINSGPYTRAYLAGKIAAGWGWKDRYDSLQEDNWGVRSGWKYKSSLGSIFELLDAKYERKFVEAKLLLTMYGYWQMEGVYVPIQDQDTRPLPPLPFVEEGWLKIYGQALLGGRQHWLRNYHGTMIDEGMSDTYVQIGYIPYELGRGVVFGSFPMIAEQLGWQDGLAGKTRFNHPGLLVHARLSRWLAAEFYYSKQSEKNAYRAQAWSSDYEHRVDLFYPIRGDDKDSDLYIGRLLIDGLDRKIGKVRLEPYFAFLRTPELETEYGYSGDAESKLFTAGAMLEVKKGGFKLNMEGAYQFGRQKLFPIDRNKQDTTTSPASGISMQYHSHVFAATSGDETYVPYCNNPCPVNGTATTSIVNNSYNRATESSVTVMNAVRVTTDGATPATAYDFTKDLTKVSYASVYNSDVTGNERFRPGFDIDYGGYMFALDAGYEWKKARLGIFGSFQYYSGDDCPYNTYEDKKFKGFISMGGYDYVGSYVKSWAFLDERKIPRPIWFSYHYKTSINSRYQLTDAMMFGAQIKVGVPGTKRGEIEIDGWMFKKTHDLNRWSKTEPLPDSIKGWPVDSVTGVWVKKGHPVGWMLPDSASRVLGYEVDITFKFKITSNTALLVQGAWFFPGQFYEDIAGMPNIRTDSSPLAWQDGVFGVGSSTFSKFVAYFICQF